MKIQIFSDIHAEGWADPARLWTYVTPQADVAIVAGDIDARVYEATVREIAGEFKKVFVLLGNHEFYRKDITWRPDITRMPENVTLLDRSAEEYEGVLFAGATLWSDMKNGDPFLAQSADRCINDFRVISTGKGRAFKARDAADIHYKDKEFLDTIVELNRGKKLVIATHFMPSYALVHEKWKGGGTDELNYYFSANCDDLVTKSEAALWVFGHTHDRRDMMIGNVRCVCNPLGYARENPDFTDMIVEI